MKDFDPSKYNPTVPYPDSQKIRQALLRGIEQGSISIPKEHLADSKKWVDDQVRLFVREGVIKYDASVAAGNAAFRTDMEEEFGFVGLPQTVKNIIHSRAWEAGHSSGYSEVRNQYHDILELVNVVIEACNQNLRVQG